jgi:hypothetical protein
MSAPATKARPAPVRIAPPTSGFPRSRVDRDAQLLDHAIVERVELVRAIDGNRRDAVGDGEGEGFVGHASI